MELLLRQSYNKEEEEEIGFNIQRVSRFKRDVNDRVRCYFQFYFKI